MSRDTWREPIYLLANIVIVLFGFSLFIDHQMSRTLLLVILLLWLVTGEFKEKFKKIFSDTVVLSFVFFMGLFVLGLLWTDDLYSGRKILERPLLYLIVPLMASLYQKAFLIYYLLAILTAVFYTAILTVLIHIGLLDMAYSIDESPFMHRVYLAGMLIFVYAYILSKISLSNTLLLNVLLIIASIILAYALIIGGSRMGYINIIVATLIILLYKFKFKSSSIVGIVIFLVLASYASYLFSPKVKSEVERTVNVVKTMDLNAQIFRQDTSKRTSLTCRFEFWYYSFEMGKEHFPLGVGTGDGILELEKFIGEEETEAIFAYCLGNGSGQFNPHNMYLFVFMQFGILGIFVLLWMLYIHMREAIKSNSIAFVVLVFTTILAQFSLSELFSSKFFIPFYGYAIMVMYLIGKEWKDNEILSRWR